MCDVQDVGDKVERGWKEWWQEWAGVVRDESRELPGVSPGIQLAILVGGVKAPRASTAVTGAAWGSLQSWFVTGGVDLDTWVMVMWS
jgi:hypothetical protein